MDRLGNEQLTEGAERSDSTKAKADAACAQRTRPGQSS